MLNVRTLTGTALGASDIVVTSVAGLAQNAAAPASQRRVQPVAERPTGRGGYPLPPLPDVFETSNQNVRVSVVTKGLPLAWSLLMLPDGDMLVSIRRPGELRAIKKGVLDPKPVAGLPPTSQLFDLALHPKFAENRWIYFGYAKPLNEKQAAIALARARWDGTSLSNPQDLYVSDPMFAGGSRMTFAPDGTIYMTISGAGGRTPTLDPRKLDTIYGKVIRLRDDGSVPPDNPFVGKPGAKPEIFSSGHRDHFGITVHPITGQIFHIEMGPLNGDKVNILKAGGDYGWPDYGHGRNNDGAPLGNPFTPGIELPILTWQPAITPSGALFYTGDQFPAWRNNLLTGVVVRGRTTGPTGVDRVVFNEKIFQSRKEFWEQRRETLLPELKQRMRDVRQGPDGLIYLLTEEKDGVVLKLEPVN
jgi:glucose/arabinose dehydrogenase